MAARKKAEEGEGAPKKRTSIKMPKKDLDKVWCSHAIFERSPIAWPRLFEHAILDLVRELPDTWYAYASSGGEIDHPSTARLGPEWNVDRYGRSLIVPAPRAPELLTTFCPMVPSSAGSVHLEICRARSNDPKHHWWMSLMSAHDPDWHNSSNPLLPSFDLKCIKGFHTLFNREYFIAFMHKHIDLLASDPECLYAYIDFSDHAHCWSGALHSHLHYGILPLYGKIERSCWFRLGLNQREWVRGLYWGNYFGPHLCSKLGGAEKLIRDFAEHLTTLPVALQKVKKPEHIAKYVRPSPNGGVVLFLSEDPSEFSPGSWWRETVPHHGVANAIWLRKRLRDANVLM